jgi:hypothetical protein
VFFLFSWVFLLWIIGSCSLELTINNDLVGFLNV